jgi:ubiquilin
MGAPPSEDQIASMLDDPNIQQTMNEALQNPAMIDMMMQQIPGLRDDPNARAMLQSPEFRRMMTNPEALRQAAAMRRMMQGGGGGAGGFPAPGVTDSTPTSDRAGTPGQVPPNPFAAGGFGGGGNPFAALFGAPGQTPAQTPPPPASAGQGTPSTGDAPPNPFASLFGNPNAAAAGGPPNPFGQITPEMMAQAQQMMNSGGFNNMFGGGSNPFGAFGQGATSPPPIQDSRPPEEIYAEQLRQLNDMGFYEFDRNVAALRRSGGSVQGAIEQLLNG